MDPAFPTPTPPTPSPLDAADTWFPIVFAIAAAVVLIGFIVVIVSIIRRNARLRSLGHDPMTVDADIAHRMATGTLTTPDAPADAAAADAAPASASVEERLAEVDELHRRGAIDDAERAATRARILDDA